MEYIDMLYGFIVNHQGTLAAIGVALLSEYLSLNPNLKSNGIIQLVLNLLKKRATPLTLIGLLLVGGCASTDTPQMMAGKSLLAIQQTIVSTRQAIVVPCQKGAIPGAECRKMDDLYQQSKPIYDAAADAEILLLRGGMAPEADYRAQLLGIESAITSIAAKYGIKEAQQ